MHGVSPVVAINAFPTDHPSEHDAIRAIAESMGARVAVCTHFADGGAGAVELAEAVVEACQRAERLPLPVPRRGHAAAEDRDDRDEGLRRRPASSTRPWRSRQLDTYERNGFGHLPVCMAKTHLSISADPTLMGAPTGHVLPVREVRATVGAGFVYPICGEMRTMPGLGTHPAAAIIDLDDDGEIVGSVLMAGVQSVERAFAVLQCLGAGPAGVSEVAERIGLPKSTVSRLLSTLQALGAVEQVADGSEYRVGDLMTEIAGGAAARARAASRRPDPSWSSWPRPSVKRPGCPCSTDERCSTSIRSTSTSPCRCATGRASASPHTPCRPGWWPSPRWGRRRVRSTWRVRWPTSARARRPMPPSSDGASAASPGEGTAWAMEEYLEGINSVAAPVLGPDGRLTAVVHVHGPSYRFPKPGEADDIAGVVAASSARIAARLGGRPTAD